MKKSMLILTSLILTGTLMLTACGTDTAETDNEAETEETTIEEILNDTDEAEEESDSNSENDNAFSDDHAVVDADGHINSNIPASHLFDKEPEDAHYSSENGSKIDSTAEFLDQHANCKDPSTRSEEFIVPHANLYVEAPEGYVAGKGDFMLIKGS